MGKVSEKLEAMAGSPICDLGEIGAAVIAAVENASPAMQEHFLREAKNAYTRGMNGARYNAAQDASLDYIVIDANVPLPPGLGNNTLGKFYEGINAIAVAQSGATQPSKAQPREYAQHGSQSMVPGLGSCGSGCSND